MTIVVELFSAPHCRYCESAYEQLDEYLAGRDVILRKLNILDDVDRAVELGILRSPALVVDGELVHQGPLGNRRLTELFGALECRG